MKQFASILLGVGVCLACGQVRAASADKEVPKVLKRLIGAIRYGKNDLAAKQVAFKPMSERLMGSAWAKMKPAEQAEFVKSLEELIRGLSFKKGHEMFKHLDAVLYDPVRLEGKEAKCKSTIVVHRNYKKTEIVIDYVLVQANGGWQVVDLVMLGESTIEGLREGQILPLLEEGGPATVLKAMRDRVAEVSKS